MKFALLTLFLSVPAFAGPVLGDFNVNLVCHGEETGGKSGPIAVSVQTVLDDAANPTYGLSMRWVSDRGFIAGPGTACGETVPAAMNCVTSVATVGGDPANYLRQVCGEAFRHFGGPYYPFDSGLSLDAHADHGRFGCAARDPGTSHTHRAITIRLTNCK